MKKIRLMLVAPVPPPYGGIGKWTLLMKKYIASKNEVELVSILNIAPKQRQLDGRSWYERIVVQGIEMLKQAKGLWKSVKKDNLSVVHLTTSAQFAIIRDILFLRICRWKKVRAIYHLHFGRTEEIARESTLEWKLLKKAISLSSITIAIDKKTEETIKQYFPAKVVRIANPFDLSTTHKCVAPSTQREVMFLGWCIKTKGIEELLVAWERIVDTYPEWKLRIVGPYQESYLLDLKKQYLLKNVIFDGEKPHDEAMEIMSKTGIFILPSYTEGFPNVILEAMAYGKPIIATDVGAIQEMLADRGGVLIPSQDVGAIEDALISLIEDEELRDVLATNAYNRVYKEYGIDTIYKKYLQVWTG